MSGQACRFSYLEFEAHALYNEALVAFRAFDVLLPWLLRGCGKSPPKVNVQRYYGTNKTSTRDPRLTRWMLKENHADWCETCPLLDSIVPVRLGEL